MSEWFDVMEMVLITLAFLSLLSKGKRIDDLESRLTELERKQEGK